MIKNRKYARKDYANKSTAHVGRIINIVTHRDISLSFLLWIIVISSRVSFCVAFGGEPRVRYYEIVPAIRFQYN